MKLIIADMASSFPPMLDLLSEIENGNFKRLKGVDFELWRMPNIGPRALWFTEKFRSLVTSNGFFLADGDLDYSKTANDSLTKLMQLSKKYPGFSKVGAALSLEDFPSVEKSKVIISGEQRNFLPIREIEPEVFLAPVDTTLAFYPKYEEIYSFWPALRVAGSATVIHSPWLESDSNLTAEQSFYLANQRKDISTVGGRSLELTNTSRPLKIEKVMPFLKLFLRWLPVQGSFLLTKIVRLTNKHSYLKVNTN